MRKPDAGNPHVRFDEGEGGSISAAPCLLYFKFHFPFKGKSAACRTFVTTGGISG